MAVAGSPWPTLPAAVSMRTVTGLPLPVMVRQVVSPCSPGRCRPGTTTSWALMSGVPGAVDGSSMHGSALIGAAGALSAVGGAETCPGNPPGDS